jgi:hypothetical protein
LQFHGREALGGVEARNVDALKSLNGAQLLAFRGLHQGPGDPRGAVTCRPTYAVHVAFRLVGQLEVDDVRDAGDINAAGGDIGGDEHPLLTVLKAFKGLAPGTLGLIAVNRAGFDTRGI